MINKDQQGGFELLSDTEDAGQEKARSIFIGGIPLNVTYRELHSYLNRFDSVVRLRLPRDKETGILKGFARAVLATVEGAQKIVSHEEHRIGDLRFGISLWKQQKDYLQEKNQQTNKKVYVKYPTGVSENELYNHFLQYGPYENFTMKTDPFTQKSRNFCYISYQYQQDAYKAIAKRIQRVGLFRVLCEMSKPPNSRPKKAPNNQQYPNEAPQTPERGFGAVNSTPSKRFDCCSLAEGQLDHPESAIHSVKPTHLAGADYFSTQTGYNHSDQGNLRFNLQPRIGGYPRMARNRVY